MIQTFRQELSWKLYALHIALLILLATHLHEYHEAAHGEGQGLTKEELQAVKKAQNIMIDGGWLIVET